MNKPLSQAKSDKYRDGWDRVFGESEMKGYLLPKEQLPTYAKCAEMLLGKSHEAWSPRLVHWLNALEGDNQ